MKNIYISYLLLFSLIMVSLFPCCQPGQNSQASKNQEKDTIHNDSLKQKKVIRVEEKVDYDKNLQQLVKDDIIYDYFALDSTGLLVYASPEDKKAGNLEFKIYYEEKDIFLNLLYKISQDSLVSVMKRKGTMKFIPELKQLTTKPYVTGQNRNPKLNKLRIAIDPGHVAGNMQEARFEHRYMSLIHPGGKKIQFYESYLNYATAKILEDTLKALGAEVLITRDDYGESALGKDFEQWLNDDFQSDIQKALDLELITPEFAQFLQQRADKKKIFHTFFKKMEMRKRIRKIREFKPHLTVVIHYNVHEPNSLRRDGEGNYRPVHNNYHMVFVPGSFMEGEMSHIESRIEFARLFLSHDLQESILFSGFLTDRIEKDLGVRKATEKDNLNYIKYNCISTEKPGVYSRNLAMTRFVRSPVCYGEPLLQDNINESIALNRKEIKVGNMVTSRRIYEVAIAYLNAILDYVDSKNNN